MMEFIVKKDCKSTDGAKVAKDMVKKATKKKKTTAPVKKVKK
jgi:hypothetical protein